MLRLDAREAELLAGRPIPDEAAARTVAADLLERGPHLVVIAVGNEGNLVCTRDDAVLLPLVDDGPVVDTTGGGDAFVATLAWALDRGEDRVRAGQLATAAAGLVVRHPGGRPALDAAAVEESADRLGDYRVSDERTTRFPVEPWRLREVDLDLDQLARTESLFALSNGHLGVRGTLDEGEPVGSPGTYLNGFFESSPAELSREGLRLSRGRASASST